MGNRELLLNLVRLRYGENMKFLPMTSITDQFEVDLGAEFFGGIDQDLPTHIGTGRLFLADRPTLTFDPTRNPELTKALITHFDLETIVLLDGAGWDPNRLFRLLVENVNGIGNALNADGPTPVQAPEFEEYKYLAALLQQLHAQGLLVFSLESRQSDVSTSVAFHSADAEALVTIQKEGYGVRSLGDKKGYVLTQTQMLEGFRVQPERATPELAELVRILRLQPGLAFYPVELAQGGQLRPTDSPEQRTKITLSTRSPLEVMFFLSHGISVPVEHIDKGLVTVTRSPDGTPFDWGKVTGDLLRVCVARHKPKRAAVAVRYRRYWFYIDDADVASKTTLALFRELLRLQQGGAPKAQPLLTLPVGGRR